MRYPPKAPPKPERRSASEVFGEYLISEGPKLLFIVIWLLGNIAIVGERVYNYTIARNDLYTLLGPQLPLARASGAGIKLNCGLVLVMVLRNFLSWVRGTFLGNYLPIDKNIIFHRNIAWTIAFYTACHIIGHFINFNKIQTLPVDTQVNLLKYPRAMTPWTLSFTTIAGTTGFIATFIQILMYTSAIKYIRGPMFNVFYYTHHLFIIFYALLCFHGISSILEMTTFWCYTIGPMVFYAIERSMRIVRGKQDTILQLAIAHPSKVIELQLKKSAFKYKPGQYLFLNCPYIAGQEWHPFTISSAPEEDFVSIHIRIVGDWTNDLWTFLNPKKQLGIVQENVITAPDGSAIFRIDGPYGAASEEVFNFRTVILVGGGIGVTPFGSILKHISFRIKMQGQNILEKVYFYWVSRDKNAFEWFSEVLAALETENINYFLEICTYLTGQLSVEEIRDVMYNGLDADHDQITGLQSPTYFGRPNWDQIFAEKAQRHSGQTVGVFFCGPSVLSKQLSRYCSKYTTTRNNTIFLYHKENF